MSKSSPNSPAETMAAIVKAVHPRLKALGFRKRRHTFNRTEEPGIVQVIGFQMGQKLPPGAEPIPGLRPDLYGRFTVNLGVAIEEAWLLSRRTLEAPFPAFLNDYDCEIRERLGQILGAQEDVWWPLDADTAGSARQVGDATVEAGTDWLGARSTRESILRKWSEGGLASLPMPTALPIVMILRKQDRHREAEQALRSYFAGVVRVPHLSYVREVAEYLGIELPPPGAAEESSPV